MRKSSDDIQGALRDISLKGWLKGIQPESLLMETTHIAKYDNNHSFGDPLVNMLEDIVDLAVFVFSELLHSTNKNRQNCHSNREVEVNVWGGRKIFYK